jgi:hypothetical protein
MTLIFASKFFSRRMSFFEKLLNGSAFEKVVDLKNFQSYSKIKNVFDFFFSAMALQIMNFLSKSCDLKVRKDVFDKNLQNVSQLSSKLFEIFLRDGARVFLAKFLQISSTEIPFSLLLFNTCTSV